MTHEQVRLIIAYIDARINELRAELKDAGSKDGGPNGSVQIFNARRDLYSSILSEDDDFDPYDTHLSP